MAERWSNMPLVSTVASEFSVPKAHSESPLSEVAKSKRLGLYSGSYVSIAIDLLEKRRFKRVKIA